MLAFAYSLEEDRIDKFYSTTPATKYKPAVDGTVEQEINMYVNKGVDAMFVEFPGDTYQYLTS